LARSNGYFSNSSMKFLQHDSPLVEFLVHGPISVKPLYAPTVTIVTQNATLEAGPTYPLLRGCDRLLGPVFDAPSVAYYDWKLWVGLACWVSTWKAVMKQRGGEDGFGEKFIFTFGLNLIMLFLLQQYEGIGVFFAGCVILMQSMLGLYLTLVCSSRLYNSRSMAIKHECAFKASSLYQDVQRSLFQTIVVFAGQLFMAYCYGSYLFNNLDPHKFSYTFWLMAFIGLQMAAFFNRGADSLLGECWDYPQWWAISDQAPDVEFWYLHPKTGKRVGPFTKPWLIMHLRGMMGFIMDSVVRDFIAFTVPVLLMHFQSPLDFVVYSVGVNFITRMDDMTTKEYTLEERDTEPTTRRPSEWTFFQ